MPAVEVFFFVASVLILGYYALLLSFYLFMVLTSLYGAWAQPRRRRLTVPGYGLDPRVAPPVTLLVPAYNEQPTIIDCVHALLALDYPSVEVIVINDGSTDDTLAELISSFSMRPADVVYQPVLPTEEIRGVYVSSQESSLTVIDKVGGGSKSDALNAGLNCCRTPWVCVIDADSILEEDALRRAMRPAIEDSTVVASCGIVRIANGCSVAGGRILRVGMPRESLAVFQVVEYLRAFLGGRLGWSWLNGLLIISGAFGIFRTDMLRDIGGYSREAVGEDMELVVRIHRHFRERAQPYKIVFVSDPVCWTEAPTQLNAFRGQRRRWQRGLAQVFAFHGSLLFRPSAGVVCFLAMPYFLLELLSPVVELAGLFIIPLAWWLGFVRDGVFLTYLIVAFLLTTLFAVWAVMIEEFTYRRYVAWGDLLRLLLFALGENLGYHQLLLWFRLEGIYDFLRGRGQWGEQKRVGFDRPTPSKV